MPARTTSVRRLARAFPVAAVLLAAGCAHAPAPVAAAQRERTTQPTARRQPRPDRVLVTGSRIPRPVGRDGLPITDSPVRIYWRDDLAQRGYVDLARGIRAADVDAQ